MFDDVQAVLFDAVGTLVFADPPVADVYYQHGRRYGSCHSRAAVASRFSQVYLQAEPLSGAAGAPPVAGSATSLDRPPTDEATEFRRWRRIVAGVFADIPDADGELFAELWRHFARSDHWALFPDVEDVWRSLEAAGLVVGIASNFDSRLASICQHLPPLDRCAHLFCSAQVGFSKPSAPFFLQVQRRLGLQPQQILLVGDHPINDYRGPRAAGWNALLLDREGNRDGLRYGVPAEHLIRHPGQLVSMLAVSSRQR